MLYGDVTAISLIIRIIEGFALVYLLSSMLNKKISRKEYIISALIMVMLYEIVSRIIPPNVNYKLVINCMIMIPVVALVYKINMYKVAIAYTLTIVIVVLIDMFCGVIFFYILDIEKFQEIGTIEYYLGMILLNILIFVAALTIKYFKMTFAKAENDKKDIGIAFNSLLMLLFIFPSISMIISYIENRPLLIQNVVITLISMFLILVISIFNSEKRYNLLVSEKELECQKSYNVILQSLVDSLRTFKHDYNNTLSTLYGYVQLGDINSLKRMFKEILEESREISSLDKLNPNLIKDPNIFGIVASKYQECVKKNITMNFEIFAELEDIEIKIYDLTRIIGIFLDNAIEASSGSRGKKINLIITEEKERVIIKISNTYSDKAISVDKMFEKGVSSKGQERGLGLYKVKEIIKRYPHVELKTIVDTEVFMQKLIIQKNIESEV